MFPKSRSTPTHAGGVRAGKIFSRFASLESSDEEEAPVASVTHATRVTEPLSLAQLIAADPVLVAMFGGASWADVLEGPCAVTAATDARANFSAAYIQAEREAHDAAQREEEAGIWCQPFSRKLEAHCGDCFDLGDLSAEEEGACMTWLYANGWHTHGSRTSLTAYPADLPPRVWVAPVVNRFAGLLEEEEAPAAVASALSQPAPRPAKKAVTVPRFCRSSGGGVACADAACRYVHADTMARVDKPCGFGAACGGSDPAKRASCLYMHPGETWSAELVVTRPVAAIATVPACGCVGGCPH